MKKLLFLVLLTGCATNKFVVGIDAISDPSKNRGSVAHVIYLGSASTLEEKELVANLEVGLVASGFRVTKDRGGADTIIIFSHKIEKQTKVGSKSTYKWVPPKSYNFNTSSYGSGGYSNTSGIIEESGIGHAEYAGEQTYLYDEYDKVVFVKAYDRVEFDSYVTRAQKNKNAPLDEKWEVRLLNIGSESNIRSVFPSMIAASYGYFGKNTHGFITKTLIGNKTGRQK